jgi:hypothetical protein
MSDLTAIIVFFGVASLAIAMGVWLFMRTELEANRAGSGTGGSETGHISRVA